MFVYLVGNTELRWFKIGVTQGDLGKRVKAIQNGVPFKTSLLAHATTRLGFLVEEETHLDQQRLRGEWFENLDIVEVATFMTERVKHYGN